MEQLPALEHDSDAWWEARREDLKDLDRGMRRQGDSSEVRAARKYLQSRFHRNSIEQENGGSKIDAFPYRLSENFRARKLAKEANQDFQTRRQRDEMLPTLARLIIDQAEMDEPKI